MSDVAFNMFSIHPTCAAIGGAQKDAFPTLGGATGYSKALSNDGGGLINDALFQSAPPLRPHTAQYSNNTMVQTKTQTLWSARGGMSLFGGEPTSPQAQLSAWDKPFCSISTTSVPVLRPTTGSAVSMRDRTPSPTFLSSNFGLSHGSSPQGVWNGAANHHQHHYEGRAYNGSASGTPGRAPMPHFPMPLPQNRPQTAAQALVGFRNNAALPFNPSAPEFRPTAPQINLSAAPSQQRRSATYSITSQPVRNTMGGASKNGTSNKVQLSDASLNGHSGDAAVSSVATAEPVKERGARLMIRPSASAAGLRGTSSSQSCRQDNLVKAIYHKIITCQSGKCNRRHSCIQCLECNSLFCEECCHINMQALSFQHCDESDEDWEEYDLRQIPSMCPNCDNHSTFTLNLPLMKLLLGQDQYRKFNKLMKSQQSTNGDAALLGMLP